MRLKDLSIDQFIIKCAILIATHRLTCLKSNIAQYNDDMSQKLHLPFNKLMIET